MFVLSLLGDETMMDIWVRKGLTLTVKWVRHSSDF